MSASARPVRRPPVNPHDPPERSLALMGREVERFEKRRSLKPAEVDQLIRMTSGVRAVVEAQLDPLSAGAKRRLRNMSDAELQARIAELEARQEPGGAGGN